MAQKTKFDGVEVKLAGEAYTLPPLPLAKMPKIKALMSGSDDMTDEFVDTLIDAIHWSLQRNYPELPRTEVENGIDMTNWQEVLGAFMKTNGFTPVTPQGGTPLGEEQAAASQT